MNDDSVSVRLNIASHRSAKNTTEIGHLSIVFSNEGQNFTSLITTMEKADKESNAVLSQLIEKGKVSQSDVEITRCLHGFPYSKLECLYSPSHWRRPGDDSHPDEIIARYVRTMLTSAADLDQYPIDCQLNIPYSKDQSKSPKRMLDLFGVDHLPQNAPIFAFIHGGYWQFGSKDAAKIMVRPLVSSGAIVAAIGYTLAPEANLDEMVAEIVESLEYLNSFALSRHSVGLYVAGHSAGAHLAFTGVAKCPNHLASVRGLVLSAGVYDLTPLVNTYIGQPLNLTEECAVRNSPICLVDDFLKKYTNVRMAIAVGEFDSPQFLNDSRQFSSFCRSSTLKVVQNEDHFSIVEHLNDMNSEIFKFIVEFMQLSMS